MKARLAFFHIGRRMVWRLRSRRNATNLSEDWITFGRHQNEWNEIFAGMLDLLALSSQARQGAIEIGNGAGEIRWRKHWRWTTISLRLVKFSERKQRLVAEALLKAARCET